MKPDFYIIPEIVKSSPKLRPCDGYIYAVVYWIERLKEGRCIASNQVIGEASGFDERTVRAGLDRLDKAGFIIRIYEDKERRIRKEIKTLVAYQQIVKETGWIGDEAKNITPSQEAKLFFTKEEGEPAVFRNKIVDEILTEKGGDRKELIAEVKKFILYWTEPNKTGTKQRWQIEKTFEVKRRLGTWMARVAERQQKGRASSATKMGVTV